MVLELLDEMQQRRRESNLISFDAVMHARREGCGRWCWSCRMKCSSNGWSLKRPASMRSSVTARRQGSGRRHWLLFHCEHSASRAFIFWSGRVILL